jgi:Xaa-Pro aminopeptidase
VKTGRADILEHRVTERELDALLVTNLVNVRYLTGFTGSNGVCLVGPGLRLFFTDFRYVTQAAEQVHGFETLRGERDLLGDVADRVHGRLGFEDATVTVRTHERLRSLIGDRAGLVTGGDIVQELRAIKEPGEVEKIRTAAELADEALTAVLERGLVGRTEREIAIDLERTMVDLGAEGYSFPPIVAHGPHGALPHAEPRREPIAADTLITIDWGAVVDGYSSDCTRTFATGELDAEAEEIYNTVLDAQEKSLAAVAPGATGKAVDAIAREAIEAAGHGEHFGHGLGHGVGLEVHESPTLSKRSNDTLVAGNVVTVEPGIYVPGRVGVRIEDLVAVTEDGHDVLNGLPKSLTVVS